MLQISELLKFAVSMNQDSKDSDSHKSFTRSSARYSREQPPVVVWNITNNCNMSCPHCYSSAHKNNPGSDLTMSNARQIIDRLHDYGIKILILSGGEPLLHPNFFDILSYAKNRGLVCHLSSNGVLIDKPLAVKLKDSGVDYVGVSLDGAPRENDSHRGFPGGFNRAFFGLLECRDQKLKTGLRFTLTDKNQDQLFYLLNIALKNNLNRFYISHLLYSGRAERYSRFDLEHKHARSMVEKIFMFALEQVKIGSSISIVSGGNDADGVYLYRFVRDQIGDAAAESILEILRLRGGNSAGEKIINIDHEGLVHPDQFFRTINCGNILEKSLEDIMSAPILEKLQKREHYLTGRCGECNYLCICRGSHRERALFVHGDIWAEDPACYLEDSFIRGEEKPCALV